MVNDIEVQAFVNAIKERPTDPNRVYNATVSRIDDEGVVWVNIHGSEKETPTASTSAEVKRGDSVTVQWRNNKLYIGGNYSNPSAGVTRVAGVEANALNALGTAETAYQFAYDAGVLAGNAMASANGKNKVYRQAVAPTGGTYAVGDIWFDTANDNKINRWDGSAWVAFTLGDDAIGNLNASHINAGEIDASIITVSNLDAGNITSGKLAAERINTSQITVGSLADGASYSTTSQMNTAIGTAVDGVKVGGRNLFRNNMFSQNGTTNGVTLSHEGGSEYISITGTSTAAGDRILADLRSISATNATVTISANLVPTNSATTYFYVSTTKNNEWYKNYEKIAWYSNTERRLTITLENGETLRYLVLKMPNGAAFNGSYRFKVELGNKQTDWSPAPEDVDADITEASKTATSYITAIDNNGIRVHAQNNPTTNYAKINADGLEVYKGGNSVAFYGDTARVGKADTRHIEIKDGGLQVYQDASTTLAHLGYGIGNAESGTAVAPFLTLGTRKAGQAVGNYSVGEGLNVEASGYVSHAEGCETTASGLHSHAEGYFTTSGGSYSHAEGSFASSSGDFSHAEGYYVMATGDYSHVEGGSTVASGDYSHAEGYSCEASGDYAHAGGHGTMAASNGQTAIGTYNKADANDVYALIVGNGASASARSNAFAVCWDGEVHIALGSDTTDTAITTALTALGWSVTA